MAGGGGDPWKISGEERAKHDAQFFTLKPVNGFVTGAQARDFFMQSGLSTQILGQIWSLADMNGDGKMDKLEFSVAMHLIKKKLQGYELPKVLPASLKVAPSPVIGSFGMQAGPMTMGQPVVMGIAPAMNPPMGLPMSGSMMPQASLGTSTMTTGSVGMPLMANGIGPGQGMLGMGIGMPPVQAASGIGSGWTMPHPNRLKYTQLFNTHDRNKRGFLTGVEARSILMQSGLPQAVLAQIWMLSDVDNDGKLTCDEFCIAMHLSDMARLGRALPPKLPAELMPSRTRAGSFGASGIPGALPVGMQPQSQVPQQKDSFGDLLGGLGMPQAAPLLNQAASAVEEPLEDISPATFEDKRKENFDKGQAELERRRALLQEQMKAEENARLEKERREAEKRERIRLEQEAKRQEEMQRQLEKQRKIEMERDEQRRKMLEQREQARRDLERQRQMEWERQRKEQLMTEKQREYEQLAVLKSQSANLQGQVESLDGKKAELALKITQVRTSVTDLTTSIESMRIQRDNTISEIDRAERESTELNQKLSRLAGEKDQLQTQMQTEQSTPLSDAHRTVMHSVELKRANLQKLRRELEQLEQETETKLLEIDQGNTQVQNLQKLVEQLQRDIPALQQKQLEMRSLQQKQDTEKIAKDRPRLEHAKKDLGAQRKREEAEKTKNSIIQDDAVQQDNWFDFGGDKSGSTAGNGDAWSSGFSSSSSRTTIAGSRTDVWGTSDPFANKAAADSHVKKTRYKVLFPFEARGEDELTVNAGDELWVWDVPSEEGMEEWFKGELNGAVGWFPQAYVEQKHDPTPVTFSSQPDSSSLFGSAFQPVQTSSHSSPLPAAGSNSSTKSASPPVAEAAFQPTPGEAHKAPDGLKAQALYPWKARQDNQLSFNKDDVIIIKEQEDMWWMGQLGNKVGWFPKAYVKLLELEKKAALTSSQTPSPMGTLEKSGSARASPAPERKDGEYYVAMYNYVSGESSDLSFNEGDMILVTKKEDDWWTGMLGDKTGIFPSTYVKRVEIQESKTTSSRVQLQDDLTAAGSFPDDPFGDNPFGDDPFGGGDTTLADNLIPVNPKVPPRRNRSIQKENVKSMKQPAVEFIAGSDIVDVEMDITCAYQSSQNKGAESLKENQNAQEGRSAGAVPDLTLSGAEGETRVVDDDILMFDLSGDLTSSKLSAFQPEASAGNGSLLDLDFGSLMSATTYTATSKALNIVKSVSQDSPASPSSPQHATFYISDSSMSASSSAAELTAIADLGVAGALNRLDSITGQSDIQADQQDLFAGMFSDQASFAGLTSVLDPSKSVKTDPPVLSLLDPDSNMTSLTKVMVTCVDYSGDGETSPDVPCRTTSLTASKHEQGKAIAVSDEPGQKSTKKPEIAMVIAPYTATGNGQLSLETGNLIHVRQKSPRGWWEGELQARGQRKKIGWFPANYVKLLGSSSSARSTPDPNITLAAGQQVSGGSRSSTPQPQPTVPAPALPQSAAEKLVALYAYAAQNEDELTFEKDAVITVLSRDNPDWWQGEVNGKTGLFPSNYVTPLNAAPSWLSDSVRQQLSGPEKQRQNYIQELIATEETYNADMAIVQETFQKPLVQAGVLTEEESQNIFVNWNDLIICNKKFLQALRVRKKMCGKGKIILMIGDILCENLPHLTPYVRFCSCQLSAAALLQRKTETSPEFVEVHKRCAATPATKGMPLSSFLLKPMQRITRYPLLLKEILKHTTSDHPDRGNLEDALQRAEELCNQVNEAVRERENSDRLEWIQQHVHCDGLAENITFNSVTNCLGSRKLIHCGILYKVKSNRELLAFLFNDFLLLTVPPRVLGSSLAVSHIFDFKSKDQYKMYKTPIVLNEAMVKKISDPEVDNCQFQVSHLEGIHHLRAPNESERDLWVKKIEDSSRHFLHTEQRKRERAHSLKCKPVGRLLVIIEEGIKLRSTTETARRVPGVGRLLVVILEGCDIRASDGAGKSDPYCEVSMGVQEHRTRVVNNTLNPKWNASMQFTIRDLDQDVLCITVYDRDIYSPNDFLGRTEVRVSEVLEEAKLKKGPITKRLILHEVDTGEVIVKLDLQLYDS